MIIFPDIEIMDGQCVNLRHGEFEQPVRYDISPMQAALNFIAQGATYLNIVDLDGVLQGGKYNADIICEIIGKVDVPVQVAGGIRTMAAAKWWIDNGAHRIVLGTAAVMDRHFLQEVCAHYPGKVVASIDEKDGQVMVNDLAYKLGYDDYIEISPFAAGVITIGFIFGAYLTETFRGGILAVPQGQLEAGRAFGMSPLKVFRRILLPQMMRHALPGLTNNWLVLLKTTALVSIIGLDDLVRKANMAAGVTQKPFTFYLLVGVIFLLFTSLSTLLLKRLEDHYNPERRGH